MFWVIGGGIALYSAAMGAIIFIVAQQYFAIKAYRTTGARAVILTVQNFYKAETGKLLIIGIGFAIVFNTGKQIDVFALMTTFIIQVVANGIAPFLIRKA